MGWGCGLSAPSGFLGGGFFEGSGGSRGKGGSREEVGAWRRLTLHLQLSPPHSRTGPQTHSLRTPPRQNPASPPARSPLLSIFFKHLNPLRMSFGARGPASRHSDSLSRASPRYQSSLGGLTSSRPFILLFDQTLLSPGIYPPCYFPLQIKV